MPATTQSASSPSYNLLDKDVLDITTLEKFHKLLSIIQGGGPSDTKSPEGKAYFDTLTLFNNNPQIRKDLADINKNIRDFAASFVLPFKALEKANAEKHPDEDPLELEIPDKLLTANEIRRIEMMADIQEFSRRAFPGKYLASRDTELVLGNILEIWEAQLKNKEQSLAKAKEKQERMQAKIEALEKQIKEAKEARELKVKAIEAERDEKRKAAEAERDEKILAHNQKNLLIEANNVIEQLLYKYSPLKGEERPIPVKTIDAEVAIIPVELLTPEIELPQMDERLVDELQQMKRDVDSLMTDLTKLEEMEAIIEGREEEFYKTLKVESIYTILPDLKSPDEEAAAHAEAERMKEEAAKRDYNAKKLLEAIGIACNATMWKLEKKLMKGKKNTSIEAVIKEINNPSNGKKYSAKIRDLAGKYQILEQISTISKTVPVKGGDSIAILAEVKATCSPRVMEFLNKKIDSKLMRTLKAIGRFFTKPMPKVRNYISSRFFAKPTITQKLSTALQETLAKSYDILRKEIPKADLAPVKVPPANAQVNAGADETADASAPPKYKNAG